MRQRRRVGNPLIAVIVSLVIAGMGCYVVIEGDAGTARVYGFVLIIMGTLGAAANLALRWHYQREDEERGGRVR